MIVFVDNVFDVRNSFSVVDVDLEFFNHVYVKNVFRRSDDEGSLHFIEDAELWEVFQRIFHCVYYFFLFGSVHVIYFDKLIGCEEKKFICVITIKVKLHTGIF